MTASPTPTASTKKPRYAPPDPTLPKPWRALVDGNTGNLYYWNVETKVTQYERPTPCFVSSQSELRGSSPMQPPLQQVTSAVRQENVTGMLGHQKGEIIVPSTSAACSKKLRYALTDSTLPKPWKALVDGNTGYLYFWNPETKVTQYERPCSVSKYSTLFSESFQDQPQGSKSIQHPRQQLVSSICEDNATQLLSHQDPIATPTVYVPFDTSTDFTEGSSMLRQNVKNLAMSPRAPLSAEAYRRQHEITVSGDDIPAPYMTFETTGFSSELLGEIRCAGFCAPTPIQAQSWPIVLGSHDIVAIAKTGSGKTLGYLIPGFIIVKHLQNDSKMGPTVLILSPTRELANQIHDEAIKFGKSSNISCTCLYGGAPKGPQLKELDRGADIIVATPGRLNDILQMRRLKLHQVSYLVLDEADRMLDMGFEPQLRKIVMEIPPKRQTLMFTATWPRNVQRIAADLLVNPVQVNIGSTDELVANKAVTQYVEIISPMEKRRRLEQILHQQEPGSRIIIFCSTKRMCDQLARNLSHHFGAVVIHGDKSQSERDCVLSQFRKGQSPILVATDVAARGLDVKDVRVVINYDFPTGVEDYVHRIGRTGRAGAMGVAYTFFCEGDAKHAINLVKILEGSSQHVPSKLQDMASHGGYGGKSRSYGFVYDGGDSYRGGRQDSFKVGGTGDGQGSSFHESFRHSSRRGCEDGRSTDNNDHENGAYCRSRSRSVSRSRNNRHDDLTDSTNQEDEKFPHRSQDSC